MVLISFLPETPTEVREKILARYETIWSDCGGVDAGIQYFLVKANLDLRKGVHLVEVAIFDDDDVLQRFRVHPKHCELTEMLRTAANWQVGDMEDIVLLPL